MNHKEEALRAVINELKYENRKFEFGSALYKLQKRVEELEETIEQLKNKI
jgi:phage shock protein A